MIWQAALMKMKTSDNQNELFDIVDENDQVVGQAKRGEVHRNKKLIHRSVGVLVFNNKGELFLQQRSATKDTDPLLWTISASGHVNSQGFARRQNFLDRKITTFRNGVVILNLFQDLIRSVFSSRWYKHPVCDLRKFCHASRNPSIFEYEKAAHRELKEELGIDLPLEFVTKYLCRAPQETEMQMLYRAKVKPCTRFNLNREEILQGKFFTRKELSDSVKSGKIKLSFMGRKALEEVGVIRIKTQGGKKDRPG